MKASLVWAGVVLVAVVAALSVGLSFAGWTDQAVIGWTTAMGALAAGVLGLLIKVESKTEDQTAQLGQIQQSVATVERRTNGELDQRIATAMEGASEKAVADVIAALRREGMFR